MIAPAVAQAPLFRRAAAIELLACAMLGVAAVFGFVSGAAVGCTTLTCYALFCLARLVPSAVLYWQYRVDALGLEAEFGTVQRRARSLVIVANLVLAGYAIANAVFDVFLPRFEVDPLSVPGLSAALGALALVTLIVASQARLLSALPTRSTRASRTTLITTCAVSAAVVLALVLHAFLPAWWIDTLADLGFAAVAANAILEAARSI